MDRTNSYISFVYDRTMKKATGNDSKFFTTNRKGENHELREELRSPQRDRKRDAVKKVNFVNLYFAVWNF